jgi:hypothetical protein
MSARPEALAVAVVSILAMWPDAARANDDPITFELAARAAFAYPTGNVDGAPGDSLRETVDGTVPLWLDGGVRLGSRWFLGIYAIYAPTLEGGALHNECGPCGGEDLAFGPEVHYHVLPDGAWDPWVGLGVGAEWLRFQNGGGSFGLVGYAFNAQVGLDAHLPSGFHIGPFFAFTVGQYTGWFADNAYGSPGTLSPLDLHEWLTLGLKGTFDGTRATPTPTKRDEEDTASETWPRGRSLVGAD